MFLIKVVRALNDNFAPMFYNATHSISAFFWIGFAVTVASLVSSYYLTVIHEAVVDATNIIKEKEKADKEKMPLN
jgi:ABC-type bacteriocin/lantibiotic exporter with double-glycine peptidase domain